MNNIIKDRLDTLFHMFLVMVGFIFPLNAKEKPVLAPLEQIAPPLLPLIGQHLLLKDIVSISRISKTCNKQVPRLLSAYLMTKTEKINFGTRKGKKKLAWFNKYAEKPLLQLKVKGVWLLNFSQFLKLSTHVRSLDFSNNRIGIWGIIQLRRREL